MLSTLFHHAQSAVESKISSAVDRALLAVPFILAAAFATASGTSYLMREYGTEPGLLIVAGIFALFGLVAMGIYSVSKARHSAIAASPQVATSPPSPEEVANEAALSAADKELLMSTLAAAAPVALPQVLRAVFRNLPLLTGIAAAIFVLTRPSVAEGPTAEDQGTETNTEPTPPFTASEPFAYATAAE
jgi:hypothetical protein